MKKIIMLSLLTLSSSILAFSQGNWRWARQGIAGGFENGNNAMILDKSGNIYSTGIFDWDSIDFQGHKLKGSCYIIKYDPNGNLLWAHSGIPDDFYAIANSWGISTDNDNNVYICGFFHDTVSFGSIKLKSLPKGARDCRDLFLVKYDSNGNVKWAKQSLSYTKLSSFTTGLACSTDPVGNTFVTGYFNDSVIFERDTILSVNNPSFFLVKYDSAGNLKWFRPALNPSPFNDQSYGFSVTLDKWGNIYVTGTFADTVILGYQALNSNSPSNILIAKYDSNGSLKWAKPFIVPGYNGSAVGSSITCDINGNPYITGQFNDTLLIGNDTLVSPFKYNTDVYWAKFDTTGNVIWAKQAYSADTPPLDWWSCGITTDRNKNIYLLPNRTFISGRHATEAKIVFGNDTLQITKAKQPAVLIRLDSLNSVTLGYIFNTGGEGRNPIVTDFNGCSIYIGGSALDTTIIFNQDTIGINSPCVYPFVAKWECGDYEKVITVTSETYNAKLYPNPNNGKFNIAINYPEFFSETEVVQIYNIYGQLDFSTNYSLSTTHCQIDLSNQPKGVYLYRIIDQQSGLISSGKFIIQ